MAVRQRAAWLLVRDNLDTSPKTPRGGFRLNRSGDRQLNSALFVVALSRTRIHQPTRDYRDRRRSEGKTDREIRRCVKRYIARRVWRLLEHPPVLEITA